MGYFVGYDRRNQYCIYDPARHSVIVRQDIHFNKQILGLVCPILTVNKFFRGTADKTPIFLFLPSETENLTRFIYANTNSTLTPVFDTFGNQDVTQPRWQLAENFSSITSELSELLYGKDLDETRGENEIQVDSLGTEYNQPSNTIPTPRGYIPAASDK